MNFVHSTGLLASSLHSFALFDHIHGLSNCHCCGIDCHFHNFGALTSSLPLCSPRPLPRPLPLPSPRPR
ncbi:hypothetical protein HK096_010707 [Nowakowskiella sp. JEL0078]|nr:hypothetical protein HK096_010707 [Nowakowskiella sp. JEL0078]